MLDLATEELLKNKGHSEMQQPQLL